MRSENATSVRCNPLVSTLLLGLFLCGPNISFIFRGKSFVCIHSHVSSGCCCFSLFNRPRGKVNIILVLVDGGGGGGGGRLAGCD